MEVLVEEGSSVTSKFIICAFSCSISYVPAFITIISSSIKVALSSGIYKRLTRCMLLFYKELVYFVKNGKFFVGLNRHLLQKKEGE
ncbi:hypothetical protein [Terrihalobacillus insolitus]|uniref:hypothetical protein n=1 Tax=Terrihalobacillus insolitus TaxID=2950438 RepID=UPI002340D2F9|nr:hypothetical protein [Terrihalobacillus insolitus]MDC3414762.1 hypothetical protein [Terrihalobacillus insolitus]